MQRVEYHSLCIDPTIYIVSEKQACFANMRFTLPLLALTGLAFAQINGTNGIGSTPSQRFVVSADQAYQIIQAGVKNATALGVPQNIAVVDPSGILVAFLRMDNAFIGSIDISQKKARTAVLFNGLSSADLYGPSQPGASLYAIEETNGGLVVFGGGSVFTSSTIRATKLTSS